MTYFCGRKTQIERITKTLAQGRHLVLQGIFGSGRTSLVRQVARCNPERWRFVFADFSRNPARIVSQLLHQMASEQTPAVVFARRDAKGLKYRLLELGSAAPQRFVIVLDNIAGLTSSKRALLRDLTWEKCFRVIAVAESFLPPEDLLRLRGGLLPCEFMRLANLRIKEAMVLLRYFSEKYFFNWTEDRIRSLAKASGGYPLLIMELVSKQRQRGNGRGALPA